MNLVGIYTDLHAALPLLYRLLEEREPHQNISHKRMPTWREHEDFVMSVPYAAWYLCVEDEPVGAVYLSKQREVGIGILRQFQGRGHAEAAVTELMRLHPRGRFLANINPANEASIALFRKLGFGGPIQVTLELDAHRK